MAEKDAKTTESKPANVGKVEVPTKAEVTKVNLAQTMKVDGLKAHTDAPAKTDSLYQTTKASATVDKGKNSQYTVEASKTVNQINPSETVVVENTHEKEVNKKSTLSQHQKTVTSLSNMGYTEENTTNSTYQGKRVITRVNEETSTHSYALGKAHGYSDGHNSSKRVETAHFDSKDRVRQTDYHYAHTDNNYASLNDQKTILNADGTLKYHASVEAQHGRSSVVNDGASLKVLDGKKSFSVDTNDDRTHYEIKKKKGKDTEEVTQLYAYKNGKVSGWQYTEKNGEYTGEHTEFSDKQTHKKIEKEQRRAAKIINKVAETEKIQSLDEYYSLLPNVTDARRALPAREFFKGNYQQEAGYQQAKAEMTEQNKQKVAQKKSVTAQDIVAAKMQQYKPR